VLKNVFGLGQGRFMVVSFMLCAIPYFAAVAGFTEPKWRLLPVVGGGDIFLLAL